MVNWKNILTNELEPADEVQKTYSGSFNGQDGQILLSSKKLLFVSEKGLFNKSYKLIFEVQFAKVDEIIRNRNILTLIEGEKRHILKTGSASTIEESIKDLKESTIIA